MYGLENVEYFCHDGFRLAFRQINPSGHTPVLLIHGFASSSFVNWVSTGWFEFLAQAGYRAIAIDNRGHGFSDKSYDLPAYEPERMADDAAVLLQYLKIGKAHIMGYSMGARIAAYLDLRHSEKVQSLVFGGLGIAMVTGAGDWQTVREALLAPNLDMITDARGRMFRKFADNTKSDRRALAACVISSKKELSEEAVRQILAPALVAVGTKDEIAGSPELLAALLPHGSVLRIPDRDHMLAVGDKVYKQGVIDFFAKHPL